MTSAGISPRSRHGEAYVPAIDGLRAIAVVLVVLFHIGTPGIGGGFAGVDVFFVISGFLITRLLANEIRDTGSLSLGQFYARRVRRLLPAFAAMLLVTSIAGAFILFPDELSRFRKSTNAAALAYSNIHFMNLAGGYFDPVSETMPLLHTWSLAVEEQFYLCWPLLMLILAKLGSRQDFQRRLAFALWTMLLLSYAACLWYSYHDPQRAFYLMPLRAWELCCGGIAQQIQSRLRIGRPMARLLVWIGLLLIFGFALFPDLARPFPGLGAVPPVLGTAALLVGVCCMRDTPEARLLASPPMRGIGLVSYAWYLWHWPVLALSRAYFLDMGSLARNVPLMLLALVLATISYRYIETPVRRARQGWFGATRSTLLAGAAFTMVTLAVGATVIHYEREAGLRVAEKWGAQLGEHPFAMSKCGVRPTQGGALAPAKQCIYGVAERDPDIVVWGDSHAGVLSEVVEAFSKEHGIAILMRSSGACPPLPGVVPIDHDSALMDCARTNRAVEEEVMGFANHGTKGVLFASRWNNYVGLPPTDPGGGHFEAVLELESGDRIPADAHFRVGTPPLDHRGAMAATEHSLRSILTKLSHAGMRIVFLAPVPEMPFMGPHCLYRHSPERCAIPRNDVDARRQPVVQMLTRLAGEFPNVRIWDPIEEFCDASRCYAYRHGILMYGDDDHMSWAMAKRLQQRYPQYLLWLADLP